MDKADKIKYLCKIIGFHRDEEKRLYPKDFGTKRNWHTHFDPSKNQNKLLFQFIDYLIDFDILKEAGTNKRGYTIYRPDRHGSLIAQDIIEKSGLIFHLDGTFDIIRNPKKGTHKL